MSQLSSLLVRWFLNIRRLFHMAIGLIFLVLAAVGVEVSYSLWRDFRSSPDVSLGKFSPVVAVFTVLLIIFALYSFLKARSIK